MKLENLCATLITNYRCLIVWKLATVIFLFLNVKTQYYADYSAQPLLLSQTMSTYEVETPRNVTVLLFWYCTSKELQKEESIVNTLIKRALLFGTQYHILTEKQILFKTDKLDTSSSKIYIKSIQPGRDNVREIQYSLSIFLGTYLMQQKHLNRRHMHYVYQSWAMGWAATNLSILLALCCVLST